MINQLDRDFLGEAQLIAEGNTMLLPERVHVRVLWGLYQRQRELLQEIVRDLDRMIAHGKEHSHAE